ncbi:hypothetical protein TGVAND_307060 [Toxoplasma gondii VAND]|uniref:Uncharacterized protein n=1 Tax=Toxoplasma gondii VAND TaxID=933077 RepID=A0A086PGJ4_TOXGO|nr:hypothetical protein TGVAND_307060 [Toxoplasma gondii VAND]
MGWCVLSARGARRPRRVFAGVEMMLRRIITVTKELSESSVTDGLPQRNRMLRRLYASGGGSKETLTREGRSQGLSVVTVSGWNRCRLGSEGACCSYVGEGIVQY